MLLIMATIAGVAAPEPIRPWMTATVPIDPLAQAMGELAKDEVVYLAANGTEQMDVGFLVAPNTQGGIMVGGPA